MFQLKSTADVHEEGIKVLVHGPAGAGKTTLCATTGGSPLIISAEGGLMSLRGHDIPYIEVSDINMLNEALKFASESKEADQFDWFMLDSISEIGEVVLNNELRKAADPRQAYGQLQLHMTEVIRKFRDIKGKNVYFSCKQERQKDDKTGQTLYVPAMPGNKLAQSIPYFFDEVFALRVEADDKGNPQRWLQTSRCIQYEAKDRSGALNQFEPPNLGLIAEKIYPKNKSEGAE